MNTRWFSPPDLGGRGRGRFAVAVGVPDYGLARDGAAQAHVAIEAALNEQAQALGWPRNLLNDRMLLYHTRADSEAALVLHLRSRFAGRVAVRIRGQDVVLPVGVVVVPIGSTDGLGPAFFRARALLDDLLPKE